MPSQIPPGQRLRISNADDLISLIPFLLGFHPTSSVVAVGLRGLQLAVTLRIDLAAFEIDDALESMKQVLRNGGADSVFIAVYDDVGTTSALDGLSCLCGEPEVTSRESCDAPIDLLYADRVAALTAVLDEASIDLAEALLLSGQRYISYLCAGPGCCPHRGRPIPASDSPIAAGAVYAGMVAAADRSQVGKELGPGPADHRAKIAELLAPHRPQAHQLSRERAGASAQQIITAALTHDEALTCGHTLTVRDEQVIQFAQALRQQHIRDEVWIAVDTAGIKGAALWANMARLLPSPYDAAPLFLFAWSAWRTGNCTLARVAAAQALHSVPSYSAAKLLISALDHSVDPRSLPALSMAAS